MGCCSQRYPQGPVLEVTLSLLCLGCFSMSVAPLALGSWAKSSAELHYSCPR